MHHAQGGPSGSTKFSLNAAPLSNGIPGRLSRCRLRNAAVSLKMLERGSSADKLFGVTEIVRATPSQRTKLVSSGNLRSSALASAAESPVLFGCVSSRSQPRQSKRGSPYFVLTISDFSSEVAVFVFDTASTALRQAREGAVIALSGPALVPPMHGDRSQNGFALSVARAGQCRLIAWCADFGRCSAHTRLPAFGGQSTGVESHVCGRAVDTRVSKLCPEHQLMHLANNGRLQARESRPSMHMRRDMRPLLPPHIDQSAQSSESSEGAMRQARSSKGIKSIADPLSNQVSSRRSQLVAGSRSRSDLTSFGSSASVARGGAISTGRQGSTKRASN